LGKGKAPTVFNGWREKKRERDLNVCIWRGLDGKQRRRDACVTDTRRGRDGWRIRAGPPIRKVIGVKDTGEGIIVRGQRLKVEGRDRKKQLEV